MNVSSNKLLILLIFLRKDRQENWIFLFLPCKNVKSTGISGLPLRADRNINILSFWSESDLPLRYYSFWLNFSYLYVCSNFNLLRIVQKFSLLLTFFSPFVMQTLRKCNQKFCICSESVLETEDLGRILLPHLRIRKFPWPTLWTTGKLRIRKYLRMNGNF